MARASTQPKNQEIALAPRNPQHPLDLFRWQFDALFDSMTSGMLAPFGQEFGPTRMWDFGVTGNDKEILVRAEMPGFDVDDLDIRLDQNTLTIRAEKQQKSDRRQEYRSFYRTVTLPAGVDSDKVQAKYRNGVLEVHVPRPEGSQAKRIPLKGQRAAGGGQSRAEQSGNGHNGHTEENEAATAGTQANQT
jgi:HSP20 family protein